MGKRLLVLIALGCGSGASSSSHPDASATAPDAHRSTPDAARTVTDAAPGQPDAAATGSADAATGTADAAPPADGTPTGLSGVTVLATAFRVLEPFGESSDSTGVSSAVLVHDGTRPCVVHSRINDGDLYAACLEDDGATWTQTAIDTDATRYVEGPLAAARDSAGREHVVYDDYTNGGLRAAHLDTGAWATEPVESDGFSHNYRAPCATADPAGGADILFTHNTTAKHGRWDGTWSIDTPAIAAPDSGLACGFAGGTLRAAYAAGFPDHITLGTSGAPWTETVVDSTTYPSGKPSLFARGTNDLVIAFMTKAAGIRIAEGAPGALTLSDVTSPPASMLDVKAIADATRVIVAVTTSEVFPGPIYGESLWLLTRSGTTWTTTRIVDDEWYGTLRIGSMERDASGVLTIVLVEGGEASYRYLYVTGPW